MHTNFRVREACKSYLWWERFRGHSRIGVTGHGRIRPAIFNIEVVDTPDP